MASSGIRALRGCRALLAPAKSSASSAVEVIKTTTSKQPKPKPKATAKPKPTKTAKATPSASTTEPKRASGIQKVSPISPQLQTFLGAPEASRSDAVKQIWSYIKLHNLQVHFPPPPPFFLLFLFFGLQFFFSRMRHEYKLFSPSRVSIAGLPGNWFWQVGSVRGESKGLFIRKLKRLVLFESGLHCNNEYWK